MGDKKIIRGASENCHTEDNSPKYRMVGNDVWLENLTYRCNCPPELGATHVALCDSVGSYFMCWCNVLLRT